MSYKFNAKDVHIVLIGNDRTFDYRCNLELLRNHFSFGSDLWITTVYNGDPDKLPSGIGENTFIHIPENRGYGLGALDAFNKGLGFASSGYRPTVAIFNFDVWFYKEEGFKLWVEEFLESEKQFGSGYLPDHNLPMTDCMIFKKNFLAKMLPMGTKVSHERRNTEKYIHMYNGTELGFQNMEEWMFNSIESNCVIEDNWWKFQRDGSPRYRWTEKYALSHLHDYSIKKKHLLRYVGNFDNKPVCKHLIENVKG